MADEAANALVSSGGDFAFPLAPVPTLDARTELDVIEQLMRAKAPVLIKNSDIVGSAVRRWNFDFLRRNLGDSEFTVFASANKNFLYWDAKKDHQAYVFEPPTAMLRMTATEFFAKCDNPGPDHAYYYLQETLNDSVGRSIVEDFVKFKWKWLAKRQQTLDWGPLSSNLLFVGMEGNVTPIHYDEQENFFCQVDGTKRCILVDPSHYQNLYPYPIHHPCDRQSQVDLDAPDLDKFPNLAQVSGYEAIVEPGDVLYIPQYWWHHIISLTPTVSVNFWYRMDGRTPKIQFPLSASQLVAARRNVEKMVAQLLDTPAHVPDFLHSILDGRFEHVLATTSRGQYPELPAPPGATGDRGGGGDEDPPGHAGASTAGAAADGASEPSNSDPDDGEVFNDDDP